MVLVVGATLFAGTLAKLHSVNRGLQTDGVLAFRLRTNERYAPARRWSSLGTLVDRLNALPGVASASASDVLPISGSLGDRHVQVEGYPFRPAESEGAGRHAIAPEHVASLFPPSSP